MSKKPGPGFSQLARKLGQLDSTLQTMKMHFGIRKAVELKNLFL